MAIEGLRHPLLLRHGAPVTELVFSPDGKRLVSADREQTVKVWDTAAGQEVITFPKASFVAFSPDGNRAILEDLKNGKAVVCDAKTGKKSCSPCRIVQAIEPPPLG